MVERNSRDRAHKSYISIDEVRAALDSMINPTGQKTFEGLKGLMLVDEFLANPDLPVLDQEHSREFALYEILCTIISNRLHQHRVALEFDPMQDDTLSRATKALIRDFGIPSSPLTCWSLLYYCYVRVELNISLSEHSDIISVDKRTTRRYRDEAIRLLTDELGYEEWQARIRQRKRRLYAQLPNINATILGREDLLENIRKLVSETLSATVFITGGRGIGKTAFTAWCVQEIIINEDLHQYDYIVWINAPSTFEEAYTQIELQIAQTNIPIKLREWLILRRVCVIVDDISHLSPQDMNALMILLKPTLVFLTSPAHIKSNHLDHYLNLPPLKDENSKALIEAYAASLHGHDMLSPQVVDLIITQSGGNPQMLRLAVNDLVIGDGVPYEEVLVRLYGASFTALQSEEKQALFCILLGSPETFTPAEVCSLWSFVDPKNILRLAQMHLLEARFSHNQYHLSDQMRDYAIHLYLTDEQSSQMVDYALHTLEMVDDPQLSARTIANILSLSWLNISESLKLRWQHTLEVVDYDWVDSHTLYNLSLTSSKQENIQRAIALRRLFKWQEADEILHEVTLNAGKSGDFILQAQARIEKSVIESYSGRFEEALKLLNQAEVTASRYKSTHLLDRVCIEKAQITLNSLKPDLAFQHLSKVSQVTSTRYLLMLAEINLLLNQTEESLKIIEQLTDKTYNVRSVHGQVYDLLGRIKLAQGEYDDAKRFFKNAIADFETANDLLGLGRSLSNFASTLMTIKDYDAAEPVLLQAQDIQKKLGDRLGAAITNVNLRKLRRIQYNKQK